MKPISGTIAPRIQPPGVVELFARPGGSDDNDGMAATQHPTIPGRGPLATYVELHNRIVAHPWNLRYIGDITGIDEEPGVDLGIDLPMAADEFAFDIFGPSPPHRTFISRATYTIRAIPALIHAFQSPSVLTHPTHSMVAITESPDPGWTPNEHRRRMLAGQGFFESGAIVGNTSDTLLVAYAGPLTPPLEILAPGARLRFGTPTTGLEFNPGLIVNARCRNIWQWIDFAIPDGNAATSLVILGGGGVASFESCSFTGLDMRHGARVDVDGCYIERSWGFNTVSHGTQMRRCAVVDALASSHEGSYFMLNCRFDGCGPIGTGGTGAYSGTTSIEDCEHVNGTGNGYEAQGQGRHTLRRTWIEDAAGHGIDVIGPVRLVLDDVQGSGNMGHGLSVRHGGQVERRNGTAIAGASGDILAGSLGTRAWTDVPIADVAGADPQLVRIHNP